MSNSFEQWLDAKGVAPRDFGRMETILKYANQYAAERESAIKAIHKKQFDNLRIVCSRMVRKNRHECAVSTMDLYELEEILAAISKSEQAQ